MRIELKNDTPEIKDLLHILNVLPQNKSIVDKIKNFTKDIREKVKEELENRQEIEAEIINMYQNDDYSIGKIAEVFNFDRDEIVNILADNNIYCYDYDLKDEDKAIDEIMQELKE